MLRNIYGPDVPDATDFYMTRFATDENLYGNYATWPIGTIPEDAQRRLQAHIDRVYFAPEDAASEYIGIPYGSIDTATRVAEGVVRCSESGDCGGYSPMDPEAPPLCRDVKPYNPNKHRKIRM